MCGFGLKYWSLGDILHYYSTRGEEFMKQNFGRSRYSGWSRMGLIVQLAVMVLALLLLTQMLFLHSLLLANFVDTLLQVLQV